MSRENADAIKKGDIIDIKVKDLMTWRPWWLNKSNLSLYKSSGVVYPKKNLDIEPYTLGYWLGDGHSRGPTITTMDDEVLQTIQSRLPSQFELRKAESKGKASTYRMVDTQHALQNRMLDSMREYDLILNKHIPLDYKTSSTEQRFELLAGIIDSDGHYQSSMNQYELTLKSEKLFDDCIDLVRSLGLVAYKARVFKTCTNAKNGPKTGTYYRMQIYGEGIENIPCKIARKVASPRVKAKNALLNGFAIKQIGQGDYYGFELDGNHRYLTGDHYVHHNSNGKSVILELFRRTLGEFYARKLPLSFITDQSRTKSSNADPAMMELKTARLAYYSESDRNERVNIAKIKELTGGETLSARALYKNQENFSANCNHIVTTNHRFVIETNEHAVWRRFLSYKFKIRFTDKCVEKNDRPRDPTLINTILENKEYHSAFLAILMHYRSRLYSEFNGEILKDPKKTIDNETEQYREKEDIFEHFIINRVVYAKGGQEQMMAKFAKLFEVYQKTRNTAFKMEEEDVIHTFRNSSIASYIKEGENGYYLQDIYALEADQTAENNSGMLLFKNWRKAVDVKK